MADLCSHPTEDVDPLDEEFYAACKLISECRTTLDEHLPNLKCESIRTDGGVQWRSGGEGTLAATQDEEGRLLVVFYATLRGHTVKVLVDSGASDNFVSVQSAKRCGLTARVGTKMRVTLADGSVKITGATACAKFNTHTTTGTYTENALALRVLPLGIQIGDRVTSILGYSPGKALGDRSPKGVACAGLVDEVFLTSAQLKKHLVSPKATRPLPSQQQRLTPNTPCRLAGDTEDADVSPAWTLKFQDLWGPEYEKEMTSALPDIDGLRHDPQDEANIHQDPELSKKGPPCQRIYKKSAEELRQLRDRVETLMAKGYIRPSSSPYAAPCLMVPKPRNPKELRLVIDYRLLNRKTVVDTYPLPDIRMMFDEMQGAKFFSSFDAMDSFWQVPMAPGDVEKTAFTTQMGSYERLVIKEWHSGVTHRRMGWTMGEMKAGVGRALAIKTY
eukprot:gene27144-biopygen28134